MTKHIVAALQISSDDEGPEATVNKILGYEQELIDNKVDLVVLPEATLGGYPKGSTFGTYVGYRLQEGREEFSRYYKQSVLVPGAEIAQLEQLSKTVDTSIIIGVIERGGNTLYCTSVYIDSIKGYVGKHRKTMPTASERLIWGQGDGSTLFTYENPKLGIIGGAICWENYMPLMRASMYGKGVLIYCTPTIDDRDGWTSLIRTIGTEGRLFAISACQYLPFTEADKSRMPGWDNSKPRFNGGSVIVNPYGDIIAGPLRGEEGLLVAQIDLDTITEARYDFDPIGHYLRGDIFQLNVDEAPRTSVKFTK
jgi:nitrilase